MWNLADDILPSLKQGKVWFLKGSWNLSSLISLSWEPLNPLSAHADLLFCKCFKKYQNNFKNSFSNSFVLRSIPVWREIVHNLDLMQLKTSKYLWIDEAFLSLAKRSNVPALFFKAIKYFYKFSSHSLSFHARYLLLFLKNLLYLLASIIWSCQRHRERNIIKLGSELKPLFSEFDMIEVKLI